MNRPEDSLQHKIVLWCQEKKILCIHVENEGKRTPRQFTRAIALGLRSGFPDLMFFKNGRIAFIELKVGKNKPSPKQVAMIDFLRGKNGR